MRKLTPYEQLKVSTCDSQSTVTTPWLELKCESNDTSQINVSEVVKGLYRYPICYIHPRTFKVEDLYSCFKNFFKKNQSQIFLIDTVKTFIPDCPKIPWLKDVNYEWETSEVLKFSRVGSLNVFDSLSAYSVIRKFLHQSLIDLGEKELTFKLKELKQYPEQFKEGVAAYIYQNYYITSRCIESLQSACDLLPSIRTKIQKYMKSETGHEKLTEKSLKNLGYSDLNELVLFEEAKMLMELLKFSPSVSVLAFASLIDFFESGSTSEKHPITSMLEGTPFEKAGIPLQKHRDINVGEGHSSVALDFLLTPHTCSSSELVNSMRLTELAIRLKQQLISRLIGMTNDLLAKAKTSSANTNP